MTRVIHVRDWNPTDPSHVYIGRAGRGLAGPFGNPVVKGRLCPECGAVHADAGSTLPCYEVHLRWRVRGDSAFRDEVASLHGKTLACFCAPGRCHGDVLARVAAELQGRSVMPASNGCEWG